MATQKRRSRFNVGGQLFETTATTLSKAGENSILRTMMDDDAEYFIDRDPACFNVLLQLLRTHELIVPPTIPDKLLFREAHYFGLLEQVRTAKSLELDGDNLKLTSSIPGRTLLNENRDLASIRADDILASGRNLRNEKGALIRASNMGSCSVANGKLFHVYDWTLQEHSIGNFEYMKIMDMDWYDSESIVISGRKYYSSLNDGDGGFGGGIGLFNAQTAKLKHKFELTQTNVATHDDDQFFTMAPGNLAIDHLNNKIFCCCKSSSYMEMEAIGVWDSTIGQQVGFLQGKHMGDLSNIFKLQWLPSNSCLVAASAYKISIIDPRSKENAPPYEVQRRGILVDMVGMEEKNSVCVVDEEGYIEFLELRRLGGRENMPHFLDARETLKATTVFPKVRSHGGKLFCSTNDIISVYSWTGFEFELTNRVQPRCGGAPIRDFSIGGDRLFSLQAHNEPSLYDIQVWETPRYLHQYQCNLML